jgi:hypothetical protein
MLNGWRLKRSLRQSRERFKLGARITLALRPGEMAHADRDTVVVTRRGSDADDKPPPKTVVVGSGGDPIVRMPTTGTVWPTFVSLGPNGDLARQIVNSQTFGSFESLARGAANEFGGLEQGSRIFARVRVAGPIAKEHIRDTLAALPDDSELILGVVWDDDD